MLFELTPQHHNELYHYGVPGMRRGVRKARPHSGMPRDSVGVDWRGRPVTPRTHDLYYHPGTGQFVAKRKLTKKQKMLRYGAKAAIGAATGALAYRTMMLNARHSDDYSDELYHYGIKGMKWGRKNGRRKNMKWRRRGLRLQREPIVRSKERKQSDALAGKVKNTGITSLSNKELRTLTERMRLENDYRRTADNPYKTRARQKGEDMFWKGAGALGGVALGTFGTIAAKNLKSKDQKKRIAAGLKVAKAVTGW